MTAPHAWSRMTWARWPTSSVYIEREVAPNDTSSSFTEFTDSSPYGCMNSKDLEPGKLPNIRAIRRTG